MNKFQLNNLLYNLMYTKAYVFRDFYKEKEKNRILIANNNLAVLFKKKDFIFNQTKGKSISLVYKGLSLYKSAYPVQNQLLHSREGFFENFFSIWSYSKKNLAGIILKRQKQGLLLRVLGIKGHLSNSELIENIPVLWRFISFFYMQYEKYYVFKPIKYKKFLNAVNKLFIYLQNVTILHITTLNAKLVLYLTRQKFLSKLQRPYSIWGVKTSLPFNFTKEKMKFRATRMELFRHLLKRTNVLRFQTKMVKNLFESFKDVFPDPKEPFYGLKISNPLFSYDNIQYKNKNNEKKNKRKRFIKK